MTSSLKAVALGLSLIAFPAFADGTRDADGLITAKIKLKLWTDTGFRTHVVHVDTNDGVVTLHGKVRTEKQQQLAAATARSIEGVKVVNDLLQVVPEDQEKAVARSDKELTAAAKKLLKSDASLKDSQITVKSVDKGVVLLTGKAVSYGDHLHALAQVDRLPGVNRVATEVKLPDDYSRDESAIFFAPGPTPAGANDARISAAVKLALWTAPQVPSTEISVDTDDSVVTLFGIVPTATVRDAAASEAAKVSGVKRVDNQLEVVPSSAKKAVDAQDADISRDLALTFKDRVEQKRVTTTVKNGTVLLTGTVNSGWAELSTVRLARGVPGVRGVENQLKVESGNN